MFTSFSHQCALNLLKKFFLTIFCFSLFLFILPNSTLADCIGGFDSTTGIPCSDGFVAPDPLDVGEGISTKTLKSQVMDIINYLLTFVAIIALVGVIYSAFLMLTAMGNEDQYNKGKTIILYIASGIVILFLSYSIVAAIIGVGDEISSSTDEFTQIQPPRQNFLQKIAWSLLNSDNSFYIASVDGLWNYNANSYSSVNFSASNSVSYGTNYYTEKYQYNFPSDNTQYNLNDLKKRLLDLKPLISNLEGNYIQRIDNALKWLDKYESSKAVEDWNAFIKEYQSLWSSLRQMPVMSARIAVPIDNGRAPLKVALSGLGSTDPTNLTIPDQNFEWSYLNLQGQEVFLPKKSVTDVEFTEAGTYIIKLKVRTAGWSSNGGQKVLDGYAFQRIIVKPALIDFKLSVNDEKITTFYKTTQEKALQGIRFDISGTTSPMGRKFTSVTWNFGDNTKEDRYDLNPVTHYYKISKEYNVQIVVTDNFNDRHSLSFKLLVKPILANFSINPAEVLIGNNVVFDATYSQFNQDQIVNYLWSITDLSGRLITEGKDKKFQSVFMQPWEYKAKLKIKDSYGEEDSQEKNFLVKSRKPTAAFSWLISKTSQPNLVAFDASKSFDPDEEELTFDWDFDWDGFFDLKEIKDLEVENTFKEVGQFKTKLKVNDPYGQSSIIEKTVTIKSILAVDFKVDNYTPLKDTAVTFTADAPNALEYYYWDFGDGAVFQSNQKEIKHTFRKSGAQDVILKVYDSQNQENKIIKKIYVSDGINPLPIVEIYNGKTLLRPKEKICFKTEPGVEIYRNSKTIFSGQKSINNKGIPENLEYYWEFGDGDYASLASVNHNYSELSLNQDCYKVTLSVKDGLTKKTLKSDVVNVRVMNQTPVLKYLEITPEGKGVTPASFQLKAVNPKDPDGSIVRYRWWYYSDDNLDPRGVKITNDPNANIQVLGEGLPWQKKNYYFVVEMTDNNNGISNSSELFHTDVPYLIENGTSTSPVVDFSMDKTVVYLGDSINFFATAYDPQGGILPNDSYKWDFDGDGKFDDVVTGPKINHRYNLPGEFSVRLKVDFNGLSTSQVKKVIVKRASQYPEAAFIYTVEGLKASFDATNTRFEEKIDNKTLWYSWDFDTSKDVNKNGIPYDDDQAQGVQVEFTFPSAGKYIVRLSVKDSVGDSDFIEREIEITGDGHSSASNQPNESLFITSAKNIISSLDLSMPKVELSQNETVDIYARILQSQGWIYEGVVNYRIIEGSGIFIPGQVRARRGVAVSTFKADSPGLVTIDVSVPGILGWPLNEKISFTVK